MSGKKSSRAEEEGYTPVSTAKLNEDPPEDASDFDKLKAQARKDDAAAAARAAKEAEVVAKSGLLTALKKEPEEEGGQTKHTPRKLPYTGGPEKPFERKGKRTASKEDK
jgi:hypothetical protein